MTPQHTSPLIREKLLSLPKPPVADVITSVSLQARILCLTALALGAFGGLCYWLSETSEPRKLWFGITIACVAVVPAALLVGLIWLLWDFVQSRKLKQLRQGEYYVHWIIDAGRWDRELEQAERSKLSLFWIAAGSLFVPGILLIFAVDTHDKFLFGSRFAYFASLLSLLTISALLIGSYCQWLASLTESLMQTRTPQVIIGPAGVYMTGRFAPFKTVGQKLTHASVSGEAAQTLLLRFRVQTKHGSVSHDHPFPFSKGEEATAHELAALLNETATR